VLQAHAARVEARRGLRARARIRVDGRGAPARQILLAERPARLRLEVLGLLGQRVMILATDGAVFDLYRAEAGTVERGDVTPELLARAAGIPVAPDLAVALLLAAPPLPGGVPRSASTDAAGSVYVAWRDVELGFDAAGELRAFRSGSGDAVLDVAYDETEGTAGGSFPHVIAIELGEARFRVDIALSDVELNPQLPAALFRIPEQPRRSALPPSSPVHVSSAAGGVRGMFQGRRAAR
jgi:hypothetical protein